ncbi:acyltransferase [Gammaproteobacteria bacterium]|nr:acyltransferase [Gammaproteobacteria bacterium]
MEFLKGALAFILLVFNTLFWCAFLLSIAILKLLFPIESWKRLCTRLIINIGECWIYCNGIWIRLLHRPQWTVEGFESLDTSNWYLSVANHQSWADIFVLQDITNRKIPMLKFFMKHVLIWVPVIGLAWWALDMPFLKRYSKEHLEKNPELRGKDIKAMEKSFDRFSRYPVSIFSFAEGTRYTEKKKIDQSSRYNFLLNPKSGGLGLTLTTMPYIKLMLDFTIVYEGSERSFWDFLCGRMSKVKVKVKQVEIPDNLLGKNYEENIEFRESLKEWTENLWLEKDRYIEELKK